MRLFNDVENEELQSLEKSLKNKKKKREPQQRIAEILTTIVHGETELTKAQQASRALFGEALDNLSASALEEIFADVPSTELERTKFEGISLIDLLSNCGISKSKGDARRLLEGGGIYLNNEKVADITVPLTNNNLIDGAILVIRSGKRNYHLVKIK